MIPEEAAKMERYIAHRAFPDGAVLSCAKCGWTVEITSAECGDYLAEGWPMHCGETMTLSKKRVA